MKTATILAIALTALVTLAQDIFFAVSPAVIAWTNVTLIRLTTYSTIETQWLGNAYATRTFQGQTMTTPTREIFVTIMQNIEDAPPVDWANS